MKHFHESSYFKREDKRHYKTTRGKELYNTKKLSRQRNLLIHFNTNCKCTNVKVYAVAHCIVTQFHPSLRPVFAHETSTNKLRFKCSPFLCHRPSVSAFYCIFEAFVCVWLPSFYNFPDWVTSSFVQLFFVSCLVLRFSAQKFPPK